MLNPPTIAFVILMAIAVFCCPRRWAVLPLLAGACWMSIGQRLDLGVFNFSGLRVLLVAGLIRVIARRERLPGGVRRTDILLVLWGLWLCVSCVFHKDPARDIITKLGEVFDAWGSYFLFRVFVVSRADVLRLFRSCAVVLVPVAAAMVYEHVTHANVFLVLGGVPHEPVFRDGKLRATGPFQSSILAGTVGATILPFIVGLWVSDKRYRKEACLGGAACLCMIFTTVSSGPVLTALVGAGALWLWRFRAHMRLFRWAAVAAYLALDLVMSRPAYYIIVRLDLTGSSTGWHRARLIETAIAHLDEWWLGGTDYTRHWMPTGISWSPDHTDLTNHYIRTGVFAGLLGMGLFIAAFVIAFFEIGKWLQNEAGAQKKNAFFMWALGSSLFAHAVTMMSVAYYDQSVMFVYLTLAAVASATAMPLSQVHVHSRHDPLAGAAEDSCNNLPTASVCFCPNKACFAPESL